MFVETSAPFSSRSLCEGRSQRDPDEHWDSVITGTSHMLSNEIFQFSTAAVHAGMGPREVLQDARKEFTHPEEGTNNLKTCFDSING